MYHNNCLSTQVTGQLTSSAHTAWEAITTPTPSTTEPRASISRTSAKTDGTGTTRATASRPTAHPLPPTARRWGSTRTGQTTRTPTECTTSKLFHKMNILSKANVV